MSSISLSQIRYVIALDKTGSFSTAAEKCFVTQSTLSTMIKKLEDELDFKLFDRNYKPIVLTSEGQKLIQQFKILANEYENLTDLCNQTKDEFYGNLKIGIIPTLAPFLLPLFLDSISKKYPNLTLQIHEITTKETLKKLKLRELDLGLLSIPLDDPEILQTSLFKEEFVVYDTRKNITTSKKYKINDIDISKLWLLEESHCLTSQIGKICKLRNNYKQDGNVKFKSGSLLSLLELVKLKKGVTLIPKLATLNKKIVNQNYIYELTKPIPVRDIGIAVYKGFSKKKFRSVIEQEIIAAVKPYLDTKIQTVDIEP